MPHILLTQVREDTTEPLSVDAASITYVNLSHDSNHHFINIMTEHGDVALRVKETALEIHAMINVALAPLYLIDVNPD